MNGVVTTAGGSASTTYTYVAAPTISNATPNVGPTAGGQSVTISGSNLATATSVTFDGTPATINSNSASSIEVTTPAHAAGAVNVVVTTAGGSASTTYTYGSAPAITSIAPSSGPVAGGQSVVISGSNLAGASVLFGNTAATITINTSASITATTPARMAGPADVNRDHRFRFLHRPRRIPLRRSCHAHLRHPQFRTASGGQTVILGGDDLALATRVTFGGAAATILATDDTSVTVRTPPLDPNPSRIGAHSHTSGHVDVEVVTPGGTAMSLGGYTYVTAPAIVAIVPNAGPSTGGQTVTINGTDLADATSVTFGGSTATIVSNTATSVVVLTPPHAPGLVDVVVTNASGERAGCPLPATWLLPEGDSTGECERDRQKDQCPSSDGRDVRGRGRSDDDGNRCCTTPAGVELRGGR